MYIQCQSRSAGYFVALFACRFNNTYNSKYYQQEKCERCGDWLYQYISSSAVASVVTPKEDPKAREVENRDIWTWGRLNVTLVCPHCQTKGMIKTKPVKRKKGISGAKATGALLTLGFSMLVTGLSRKEAKTQAHCGSCDSTWDF